MPATGVKQELESRRNLRTVICTMNAQLDDLVRHQNEGVFADSEIRCDSAAVDDVEQSRERRGSIDDAVDFPGLSN